MSGEARGMAQTPNAAWVPLLALALLGGSAVALLSRLGPLPQTAAVVGMGVALPLALLFLARPWVALAAYLLVLPVMVEVPVAAGLNAGEVLTLLVLLLGTVTLWGVGHRIRGSMRRLRPILLPLALLAVVSLVSLLVNGILRFEEIGSALFKIVAFAVIPLLVHVHAPEARQAKKVLVAILIGGALVAAYTITAYLLGWTYDPEYDWNRPVGTFEHWNLLGGCMALMSLPTLGLAGVSRGATRYALALLFALEIVVLMLSLTLGSMLGVVIGSAIVLLFLMRPRISRVLPILLVGALAASVAFATDPLLREKVTQFDERLTDRLITYATGVNMFRDKFWWGFGSEQQMAEELFRGEADYGITIFGVSGVVPHNAVLKIGVEKGVFGVAIFLLLLVGTLQLMLRRRRDFAADATAPLYYGLIAGLLAFLVQNMTNELLLHARLGILFFTMVALLDRLAPDRHET